MSNIDDELESIRQRKRDALTRAAEESTGPIHINGKGHLQELLEENEIVLVDFYADWCGPCKMLEPTIESIAEETSATVAKVDIDANRGIAQEFNVQGVPTIYLFADGEPVDRMVGVQDEGTLRNQIANVSG